MPALYPMGVAPEDYSVGDTVKWFIDQNAISPYVGKVTHIVPATNKVWVVWPVGGSTQHNPEELIIVPPEQGESPVSVDPGYSSWEKDKSEKFFGTLSPKVIKKLAHSVVSAKDERLAGLLVEKEETPKMASKIADTFAANNINKVTERVMMCKQAGLSDLQAYHKMYDLYSKTASDTSLRDSVFSVYGNPVED